MDGRILEESTHSCTVLCIDVTLEGTEGALEIRGLPVHHLLKGLQLLPLLGRNWSRTALIPLSSSVGGESSVQGCSQEGILLLTQFQIAIVTDS